MKLGESKKLIEENKYNKKQIYFNSSNILEIIVVLYCLIIFRNYLSVNVLEILSSRLEKNIINSVFVCNSVDKNVKRQKDGIFVKNSYDENKLKNTDKKRKIILSILGLAFAFNISKKFDIVNKINIIIIYIVDVIYCIVYCIYNKSRKRITLLQNVENNCRINNKCNNLCIT